MAEKTKNKKWIKFRHRVGRNLVSAYVSPIAKHKYHAKVEKFKAQGKRPYLIVLNHQTAYDQFFVGMAFKGPVYYVATEDLFSMGLVSKIINYLVAPIPIKKQTTDMRAVMACAKIAKEGGTIALAPEGNRTYCGRTLDFKKSIVKLARLTKLPIAIFKIEGGYGVQPRWSDKVRKGKIHAYVSKVLEQEDYAKMTDDQLYDFLKQELWQDESGDTGIYYSKRSAEYLERVVYVCPDCGLTTFISKGQIITCEKCGKQIRYTETKALVGENCQFPFKTISEWYDYQLSFINGLDLQTLTQTPVYTDKVRFSEVILYKRKRLIDKNSTANLYGDRITINGKKADFVFSFDNLDAVTVLGKNKVNVYFDGKVYQIKGDKRFNALRYVNFFHRYQNTKEENTDGFLGL